MLRNYTFGLALLDIVGCALGASVVLAVIFSVIKIPPPPLAPNEFILVQASGKWQGDGAIPDDPELLGFFVRAPGGQTVIIPPIESGVQEARSYLIDDLRIAKSVELVSAWSEDLQRQTSYLSINQPSIGKWQVVPYYFDFPSWLSGKRVQADSLNNIAIEFWTSKKQGGSNRVAEAPEPMRHPGFDNGGNVVSRTLNIEISR